MEARILPLPTPALRSAEPHGAAPQVRVDGRPDRRRATRPHGPGARRVARRARARRAPDVVERALRIGLLAIQDAVDDDRRRRRPPRVREARRPDQRPSTSRPRAPSRTCCAPTSPTATGACRGRSRSSSATRAPCSSSSTSCSTRRGGTPRSGGSAACSASTSTATGRKVAQLLDPTRLGSPLHQFRQEIADGLQGRPRAAQRRSRRRRRARADERSQVRGEGRRLRGPARGPARRRSRGAPATSSTGPGTETGSLLGSKKGDFVLTIDPRLARGADLRVVIEAKDRAMSQRAMREELREARENRGATVAVAVWTPAHAPTGIAPFAMVGDDVHVVVDPEAPGRRLPRGRHPAGAPARARDARRSGRSTSTPRRSAGRSPACASSSTRSARSRPS